MDVDAEARECAEIIRMTFEGNALQADKEAWAARRIAALVREAVAEERERHTGARIVTSYPACNSDD